LAAGAWSPGHLAQLSAARFKNKLVSPRAAQSSPAPSALARFSSAKPWGGSDALATSFRGKLDVLEFAFIQFPRGLCPRRPELYQIRPQLRVTFSFSQSDAFAGTLQAFLRFSAHGNLMRRPSHSK
jgi:hypothetical protein